MILKETYIEKCEELSVTARSADQPNKPLPLVKRDFYIKKAYFLDVA